MFNFLKKVRCNAITDYAEDGVAIMVACVTSKAQIEAMSKEDNEDRE